MKNKTVCIITGPCGAGKSTIAKGLANDIKNSVYIDVDEVRDMIKNGYASPVKYTKESKKQLNLGKKNTIDLAINFLNAGFNVFIDDVLETKAETNNYLKKLKNYQVHIFLLLPKKRVLSNRDVRRRKNKVMGKRALELHDIFTKRISEKKWHILDTSNHTVKQTKKEILSILKKS